MDWNKIPVAGYVFFAIFLLVSLIHLIFCFYENEKWRKITKCLTTGSLFIALVIAIPAHPLPYIGLFLGLLGDFFLLKKHKVWPFALGLISFLAGHVVYIAEIFLLTGELSWGYIVSFVFYLVIFPIAFYNLIHRLIHQRHLAFGGTLYAAVISSALLMTIFSLANGASEYMVLVLLGYIAFIISDTMLALTLFKRNIKRRDFFIMSTYLLAQGLIAVGFCFYLLFA